MMPTSSHGRHSADAQMQLLVDDRVLPVIQLGPDFLLVDTAVGQARDEAMLVPRVDRSERRWRVRLPEGISPVSKRVALAVA
ncbi:MAG TPA: hypothetical protein PKM43_20035 [Verrucomicrobiota bacterium]|nr:hypothetical protein [Verrucomicrobiota bacterium]HRZ37590.1 hypothetical protein [Candidatus Paceibacterota bacterium]HRZ57577.1 hypothetical protein [Candidatus Paceibacterota bacterium]